MPIVKIITIIFLFLDVTWKFVYNTNNYFNMVWRGSRLYQKLWHTSPLFQLDALL